MSIISHVSVGSTPDKMKEMLALYDAVADKLGASRKMAVDKEGKHVDDVSSLSENVVTVAYGKYYPEFWVGLPYDKGDQSAGNGVHIAFSCKSAKQVDEVYKAAIEKGATCNGAPGLREEYSDKYYGAFFIDQCGNKIEAMFWDMGIFNYCSIM